MNSIRKQFLQQLSEGTELVESSDEDSYSSVASLDISTKRFVPVPSICNSTPDSMKMMVNAHTMTSFINSEQILRSAVHELCYILIDNIISDMFKSLEVHSMKEKLFNEKLNNEFLLNELTNLKNEKNRDLISFQNVLESINSKTFSLLHRPVVPLISHKVDEDNDPFESIGRGLFDL